MPLGQVEQDLEGGTNRCFYEMTTFRSRFYAELCLFILEGNPGQSKKKMCYCIYK